MYFALTPTLIDDILFCMEDQNRVFLLDTERIVILNQTEIIGKPVNDKADGRFITLPEWSSMDGYRLMENFAAGFRNKSVRDALNESLDRGKGVFRAFKEVLGCYPLVEKRWLAFKKREMQQRIIEWYKALCTSLNIAIIGEEPEETRDLVLEDFIFREYRLDDYDVVAALRYAALEKAGAFADIPSSFGDAERGEPLFVAESAQGDCAAFAAVERDGSARSISALVVKPEYRGLGIAAELATRLLEYLKADGAELVFIDIPLEAEGFSRFLHRASFTPVLTRYCLDMTESR
jgi:ribosomal protein S18 acetylase RimI-like enzyme